MISLCKILPRLLIPIFAKTDLEDAPFAPNPWLISPDFPPRKIYSAKTITFGSLILLSKEFFRTPRTRRMLKVIRPEAGEDLRSSNASEFSEFRQVSQNLEDEKNGTAFFE